MEGPDSPDAADKAIAFLKRVEQAWKSFGRFLEIFPWHYKHVHARVVRRGPSAIARWNKKNTRSFMNLQGGLFAGAQLAGAALGGADMRAVDLTGANLEGAFMGSRLNDAQLSRANLRDADMSGDWQGANLQGADLTGACVMMANLGRVNLQGATLIGTEVSDCSLRGANLRDANFEHSNLDDTRFHGAILDGVNLTHSKMYRAKLVNCDLTGVDLTGANLTEADLEGATNYTEIRGISGASVHRVHNAPAGFIEWALSQGAVDESRSRSWTPPDSLYLQAKVARDEKQILKRAALSTHKIIWPIALFGVFLTVIGIGGFINSEIKPLYHAFQQRNWAQVECEIVRSEFSHGLESVAGIKIKIYRVHIEYQYEWSNLLYVGTAFEEYVRDNEGDAKRFIETFPMGRKMKAFVDPDSPDRSALTKHTFGFGDIFRTAILLITTTGGVFMMLMGFGNHER